jgi:hypothetical protein
MIARRLQPHHKAVPLGENGCKQVGAKALSV